MTRGRAYGADFYTLWDSGTPDPVPFGLFGGFATIEQLPGFDADAAVIGHIDATFRKLAVFYGHLLGIRPIRLVFDDGPVARHRAETDEVNERIRAVAQATGLPLRHKVECLFLRARLDGASLRLDLAASERLNCAATWSDFAERSICYANHLTRRFHLPLVEEQERLAGIPPLGEALGLLADRVRALSNKGAYLRFLAVSAAAGDRLPCAPTRVGTLGSSGSEAVRYEDVKALLEADGGQVRAGARIFVKPVWSGGGTEAVTLRPGQDAQLKGPREYLLQPEIDAGTASDREGLPGRIGISLFIDPGGSHAIRAITQQVYRDEDCLCHVGSVADTALSRRILSLIGEARILGHARRLHDRCGIAGPVGIDLVFDRHSGNYADIVDANVRLTAAAPTYLFQRLLEESGRPAQAVSVVGNGGMLELPDPARTLQRLRGAGTLYDRDRAAGLVPVPSYSSPQSFDIAFVEPGREGPGGALAALRAVCDGALPDVFTGPSDEASSPNEW